jgi:hypothetical protein
MLRTSSKVARERIWRRAPARHAMWDALGHGAERDVAVLVSVIAILAGESSNLCTGERRLQSPWLWVYLPCSGASVDEGKQMQND